MHNVSDLAKTRRFTPPLDVPTTKFVRVDEIEATVPFSPYDSLEVSTTPSTPLPPSSTPRRLPSRSR
jgi:hypothetical protein